MAAVNLEEMEDFERFRLNCGGFPPDDIEALNMFRRIKAFAESSNNTDE